MQTPFSSTSWGLACVTKTEGEFRKKKIKCAFWIHKRQAEASFHGKEVGGAEWKDIETHHHE